MNKKKYAYFGVVFLIVISSSIAFTKISGDQSAILAPPTVDFTFNNNTCSGQSVSFNSIVSGVGPFEYEWNFGDGTGISTQANPNHVFNTFGCGTQNFNVTLTVTDDNGEVNTDTQTITILQEPNIDFEDLNAGFNVPFQNCNAASIDYLVSVGNVSVSNGCVTTYSINWGDGSSDTNVSFPIDHIYTTLGTFNMVITALGNNGCEAQKNYTVANSSNPTGGIVSPGSTVNLCTPIIPLEFAISNWGGNPPDAVYNINYGDGTTLTLSQIDLESSTFYNSANPLASDDYPIPHEYTESNCPNSNYTVFLDIITSCGESNFTAGPITILERPEVSFDTDDIACQNVNISITNTSSTGYNQNCTTGAAWFWDMGDGTTYTDFEPNHNYSSPGVYTISLFAENFCGQTNPVTQDICIEPPLNPTFTTNNNEGCAPINITLNNTTDLTDQCGAPTYEWIVAYTPDFCGTGSDFNFINGTDANSVNPQIEFINPGTYEIVLESTNSCGTASSLPMEIFIKSPPQVTLDDIDDFCASDSVITPSFTVENCGPNPPTYNWSLNIGTSPVDWEFINGTNANSDIPEIEFYTPNTYILSLEVTNSCGSNIDTQDFEFSPVPEITSTDLTQTICSGTSIEEIIFQSNNSNTNYSWTGTSPTGNVSGIIPSGTSDNIPVHILTLNSGTTGTVVYTVTPSLVASCPGDPVEFTITVNEGPSIATQPVGGTYCINATAEVLTFTLGGNATGTINYQWYVNDNGSNNPADPDTTAVPSPEGQQADYQPPTDTVGTLYYFCVISFSGTGSCSEIITIPAAIEVTPNVVISDEAPLEQTICSGANTEELSFSINDGGAGTITYNWYASDDNVIDASDTPVGTNSNTYDPGILTTPGLYYYYVTIDVDESLGCSDVSSGIFEVEVLEDPTVTITPVDQTICTNVSADLLVAQVSGGVDINNDGIIDDTDYEFQWFLNGVEVIGANGSTYDHDITLPAGVYNYYCEVSQPNNLDCNGTSNTVTITVNEGPSIATQPVGGIYCINGTAEILTFTLGGNATGTINYQWYVNDNGSNNPADPNTTAVPSPEGQQADYQPPTDTVGTLYYFCVISFSGSGSCSEIITIPVEIVVTPNVEISNEMPLAQIICSGANAEELSFSINDGGAGTITYNWYSSDDNVIDASDTPVGTNSNTYDPGILTTPGLYYYYVTVDVDESLGCSDVSSEIFEVEVLEDPTVTITPVDQTICTNVSADLLVAQVSGGVDINNDGIIDNTDYEFQWFLNGVEITGANGSTYDHDITLPAGVYNYYCEVSQSNDLDCNGTSNTVTITVNEGPAISTQPMGDEYCLGDTIADLQVNILNGVGTPTYQWYSNDTNDTDTPDSVGIDSNILTIPNTGVGTLYYYVEVSFSQGGCGDLTSEIVPITINQVPEISNYDALICSNNEFSVIPDDTNGDIVPANTTYTWSTPVINPAGAILGATEELTQVNEISQLLENTTLNPATVTYSVIPISGDCVGEEFDVVVTVNPSISVTATPINNDCFESNNASIEITIIGGVPFTTGDPYIITWTGPNGFTSTDEDIFNLEAGNYTLNIEDDGGCPYSESFTIEEPEMFMFGTTDFDPQTISCFGADDGTIGITVEGGTLPYTYSWTRDGIPFSADEDLVNLGPGSYEITVTDSNNCGPIVQSFLIEEPPLLEVTLDTQTNVLCFGESTGAININVVGGRPDYTYSWAGPNGFVSTNQNIDALFAGVYTVTVTDDSDCVDTLQLTILQNDLITIDVTTTEIECYGDNDASITINNISGGVAPYEIAWSNFGTGNVQTNLSAGTYTITITDAENCFREFPIIIDEAPIFLIDPVVTQMSCSGENDASIILNFQGGIDPVTVVWSDDPVAGVERNNLAPGNYSVTITDGTPCVIQEIFTINNIAPLQLSATITNALDCDDANSGEINLIVTGGTGDYEFQWSNGANTEDLNDIGPNFYSVLVTDENGCEIEGDWEVTRFDPLEVNVDTQSEVDCEAQTVDQTFVAIGSGGVPPYQFNWSDGNVSGLNNEMMTTDVNGLVILDVTDSLGCTTNFTFNVETPVLGDPDFDTSSFGLINYGVFAIQDPIQFTNTATGDYISVLWDFGDGNFSGEENPVHTYVQTGNYVVTQTVTYPFGCVYTKIVTLIVEKGYQLIMPNAFTPNDDGLNDFFGPEYIGLNELEINIYDTWGSLIYSESGDNIRGWDGKINDEDAENGNYYYTFKASTFYEDVIEKQGAFVFIK